MAGPPTNSDLPPSARLRNSSCAICRIATPLGFSVETLLLMNSNAWRSIARSCGNTRTPAVADDDRHPAARRRSSACSGQLRSPDRRRCRNPFPDRRLQSNGRPAGSRSADWSCCKTLRERRRRCRPRVERAILLRRGHGAMIGDLGQESRPERRPSAPGLRPRRSSDRSEPGRS